MAIQLEWGTILDAQAPFWSGTFPRSAEKKLMNPIRYRLNYRIVPCYMGLSVVCLLLGIVLMELDDRMYLPVFLASLGIIAVASVALLLTIPKTRQKELAAEKARYEFDTSAVEDADSYVIAYEGGDVELSRNGIRYHGEFYWYNHVGPRLVTSNKCNRVWVAIQFGGRNDSSVFLHLNPLVIKAVQYLEVPLENGEMLDYLIEHPANAFAQIYNSGTFSVPEDD